MPNLNAIKINDDLTQTVLQFIDKGTNYSKISFNQDLENVIPIIISIDNMYQYLKIGYINIRLNVCPCDTQLSKSQLNNGVIKYSVYPTYGIWQFKVGNIEEFMNNKFFECKELNGITYLECVFFQSYSGDDLTVYELDNPYVVQIFEVPEVDFDLNIFAVEFDKHKKFTI